MIFISFEGIGLYFVDIWPFYSYSRERERQVVTRPSESITSLGSFSLCFIFWFYLLCPVKYVTYIVTNTPFWNGSLYFLFKLFNPPIFYKIIPSYYNIPEFKMGLIRDCRQIIKKKELWRYLNGFPENLLVVLSYRFFFSILKISKVNRTFNSF